MFAKPCQLPSGGFFSDLLDDTPTCDSPMKEKVELLQEVFRQRPEAAEMIKVEMTKEGGTPAHGVELSRARAIGFVEEINVFMQRYRVLCVSIFHDSEGMWLRYAENHKGIALRIEPSLAKDSKFRLFRKVIYRENRPPLFEDSIDFLAGGLFGDQALRLREMIERIVYAKTLDWQHEGEYRLAIPMGRNEKPWHLLPYHPEEITELYLGLAMEETDMEEILGDALKVNPDIVVHRARRDRSGDLLFDRTET